MTPDLEDGIQELAENEYLIGILNYDDEFESATLLYQTEVDGEHLAELEERNSLSVAAATANLSDPDKFDEEDRRDEFTEFLEDNGYDFSDYADGFGHQIYTTEWRNKWLEELNDEVLRKNIEGADQAFDHAHILAVKKYEKAESFKDVLERGESIRKGYLEWQEKD